MRDPEGELARRKDEGEPLGGYPRAVHNILRDVGMPTLAEIDAAFRVAQMESRWSINKLGTVKRMLEAAERVRNPETDGPPEKEMGAMNDEAMRKFLVEWLNKRGVVFARPDDVRPGAGDDTTLVMGAFNLDELAADLVRWLRPAVW